jgi:hypothetical protein
LVDLSGLIDDGNIIQALYPNLTTGQIKIGNSGFEIEKAALF